MRKYGLLVLLTAGTMAIAAAVLLLTPAAMARAAPRLMVLYFDNNTADASYDPLAKGLADMMITDLAAVPGLEIVEREKLDTLLGELKLQRSKYIDPKTAQRIGKGVGATHAVTGALLSLDPVVRIDVRVVKIDSATVIKASTVSGRKDDFFSLWQKLSAQLVEGLSTAFPVTAPAAGLARAAAATNKVKDLGTVLEYSRGLDASDRGDLDAASKHLQNVVSASPDFTLGKQRYGQFMKALDEARNQRKNALAESEKRLLANIRSKLAGGSPAERSGYRVLLAQHHVKLLADAIRAGKPPAAYRAHVRAHVDLVLALRREERLASDSYLSSEDIKLALEIGIKSPGKMYGDVEYRLEELADFLMSNRSPFSWQSLDASRVPCFYTLDPAYPALVARSYDDALAGIITRHDEYEERDAMEALRGHAEALAWLGRPEEAIAKLQSSLVRYPKAEEFARNEALLRDILAGKTLYAGCKHPISPSVPEKRVQAARAPAKVQADNGESPSAPEKRAQAAHAPAQVRADSGAGARGLIKCWLGVTTQDLTPELAKSYGLASTRGAVVAGVFPGSPAAKAGIQADDVLTRFDDKSVDTSLALHALIGQADSGKSVQVKLWRHGGAHRVNVQLEAEERESGVSGLRLRPLRPPSPHQELRASQGVLVSEVQPTSAAAQAGLRAGDVVIELGGKPVTAVEELAKALRQLVPGQIVRLKVSRGDGERFFVALEKR